ncbi:MAG: YqaJ viral recombinase family protein [Oscillospiraceae bacterium]|nr:YqaJ viral recombinase family protein [Oscillospiraceae bacterium]
MNENKLTFIPTVGMSLEEWLLQRRKSIGGSDAAAIVGLSKWSSPYSIWAEKTGRLPEAEDTEAMRIGRELEEYVAQRWCEATGKRVRRRNAIIKNELYPFAHANVDRLVVGEAAGLECKTTSTLDVKQFRGVDFPEKYYAQCVHYMAVTGASRWYLAVLVFGRGFFTYVLERDQAEIDALMAAEETFWGEYVATDTAPPPDGTDATTDAITTIYAETAGGSAELFGREALLDERAALKDQINVLNTRIIEIDNTIKEDMGETERGTAGPWTVTWKTQTRRTFQAKEFSADHPDIDLDSYYKEAPSRVFKVTRKD